MQVLASSVLRMDANWVDYLLVAIYFVFVLGIGLLALPTGLLGSAMYEQLTAKPCPHCGRDPKAAVQATVVPSIGDPEPKVGEPTSETTPDGLSDSD